MKKSILLTIAIVIAFTSVSFAQFGLGGKSKADKNDKKKGEFRWGVKGGMNTSDVNPSDLLITNSEGLERFKLAVDDAKFGVHIGGFMRYQKGKRFFVQPELHLSTTRTDFSLTDLATTEPVAQLFTESYHNIKLPVNLGIKYGPLRVQAGTIGSLHLAGNSGLKDVEGYQQNFSALALGWQAGIGLDIWKFAIDLRYEGDFGDYGKHMEFFDNQVAFDDKDKRLKFAVGWMF
jgi:hypothetical protein